MPHRSQYAPKVLVAILWSVPGCFLFLTTRVGFLLTWLVLLPDWLAKIAIAFVASPEFLVLGGMIIGLSSLLLWRRFSNTNATVVGILIAFLLLCSSAVFASTDTQGIAPYIISAAQAGDVRGTREQLLIQCGLNGTPKYTQKLIDLGADVNARDPEGRSALYWASSGGRNSEVMELLLQLGAKPDAEALMNAAFWGRLEAIQLMFDATPDDGKALVAESGNEALEANKTHTSASASD